MTELEKRAEIFAYNMATAFPFKQVEGYRINLRKEIRWARENPPVAYHGVKVEQVHFNKGWQSFADHIAACLGKEKK